MDGGNENVERHREVFEAGPPVLLPHRERCGRACRIDLGVSWDGVTQLCI